MKEVEDIIIEAEQDWYEDADSKTGWTSAGWYRMDGVPLFLDLYEIEIVEVLDTDKFGNIIKAKLKIIIE